MLSRVGTIPLLLLAREGDGLTGVHLLAGTDDLPRGYLLSEPHDVTLVDLLGRGDELYVLNDVGRRAPPRRLGDDPPTARPPSPGYGRHE